MRRIAVATCLVVLALAVFASSSTAQDPSLELEDPLTAACSHLWAVGDNENLGVKNCRRRGPDVIRGNRATVQLRIVTEFQVYELDVELRKSLWEVIAWR